MALAVVGMQGRTNFGGTLLGWGLHFSKKMPLHLAQGAGMGSGSAVVVTVRHVEQSQLRLRMRFSRPTISSGGPRRSSRSRSVFMAQDVGEINRRPLRARPDFQVRRRARKLAQCPSRPHHHRPSAAQPGAQPLSPIVRRAAKA